MVVKVASRCNLNCTYCYLYNHEDETYKLQPKFMLQSVFDAAMRRAYEWAEQQPDHSTVSIILHGGEPTLAGADRLESYCAAAKDILGSRLGAIAIQTNATLLSSDVLDVLTRHNVCIGVSLDGPSELQNKNRSFRNGMNSYQATMSGIRRLQEASIPVRVLCVVDPSADGAVVYRHFRELGILSFDFLLPDISHDNVLRVFGGLGEAPVARFLISAFDEWIAEDNPDVSIRVFRGLLRSILGGTSDNDAFGNSLMSYLIVETNGDIEALDALKVCASGITRTGLNVLENSFSEIRGSGSLLEKAMFDGITPADECLACPELRVCGGGYLPHRYSTERQFQNPSVWCSDIKMLFGHLRRSVETNGR